MQARLGDVAEVRLGRQRAPKNHQGENMRPYVRAANIGWDGLKLDDVLEMNFTDAEMRQYALQSGDILLSEASGSAAEVGKPALWQGEIPNCAFQNTLIRVRAKTHEPQYLLHFFRWMAASGQTARIARGVGIRHLGQAAVADLVVPVPSLAEQRRIAAILDRADALRAKRRQTLTLLDDLVQAVFLDMFGDPDDAIAKGSARPLSDFVKNLQGGKSLVASDASGISRHRVLRISAVTRMRFRPHESKAVPDDYQPPLEHRVRPGDLLISRANTAELVGALAYVWDTPPNLLLPDKLRRPGESGDPTC